MRRTLALAFGAAFFGSLLACTAILGNYTVGTAGDAGTDTVVGPDSVAPDGGPDAPAVAPPMTCDVNGSAATLDTDATLQDRMWVHSLSGNPGSFRVLVMRGGDVSSYTVDDKFGNKQLQSVGGFSPNFNIMGVTSYDGGFVVLAISDKGGSHLEAIRFDDTAAAPEGPFTVVSGLSANANSDFQFALAPINAANHEFFLAYSHGAGTGVWEIDSHRVVLESTAQPLPTEPKTMTATLRPNLFGASILLAKAATQAFIFVGGDQGQGDLQFFETDFNATLLKAPNVIKGPGGAFFIPLGGMPAPGPDDLNAFATIQGDLSNTNIPLGIRVGSVTGPTLLTSWDPGALPPLVVLSAAQLSVDKGTALWQFYPVQGPQYISAARNTNTGAGVNLNWLDAAGHLRGLRAGPTALFKTDVVQTAAGSIVGVPNPIASDLVVAWLTGSFELKIAKIGCLK